MCAKEMMCIVSNVSEAMRKVFGKETNPLGTVKKMRMNNKADTC